MISSRLVQAPLMILFSPIENRQKEFRFEYEKLAQTDDDPISQWLKIAKARGETKESDPILLYLVMELHRKVDALEKLIKNEQPNYIELDNSSPIELIGHGVFILSNPLLKKGVEYYGRVDLPTFPKRLVPLFFVANDEKTAKIKAMHERDIKDWDAYIAARERALIREKKGLDV